MFLQRTDPLRWTTHLGECLSHLEQNAECANDHILVQQVKFQLIIEKKNLSTWYDDIMSGSGQASGASTFFLQALHSQLQLVKNQLPLEVQNNGIVLLHYHHAHLTLSESALGSWWNSGQPTLGLQEVKYLYGCIDSIKSWFDIFFTISPASYIGFPFSMYAQSVSCLLVLFRLSTLENPSWDKSHARKTIDVLEVMDQMVRNLEEVATLAGLESEEPGGDMYSRTAKKFASVRPLWEAKLRSTSYSCTTEDNPLGPFGISANNNNNNNTTTNNTTASQGGAAGAAGGSGGGGGGGGNAAEEPFQFSETEWMDLNETDWLTDFLTASNTATNFMLGGGGGTPRY